MATRLNSKLLRIAKIVLSILLIWFIWRYFFGQDLKGVWVEISQVPLFVFVVLVLFSLGNWLAEAIKWKILVANLERISLWQAFLGVCAGVAASNVLPFRVGEFLGKVIFLKNENRIQASANSVFGGMIQLMVTLLIGVVPAWVLLRSYAPGWVITGALLGLIPLLIIAGLLIGARSLKEKQKTRLAKVIRNFKNFTALQLLQLFAMCMLRYGVYSLAYFYILEYFGIVQDWKGWLGIATIYFIQSFTPSTVVTDLGVRTTLPLLVFPVADALQVKLLAAAVLNYCFSVLLPSLFGLFAILAKRAANFR